MSYPCVKRCFDVVFSGFALLVLAPLFLVVAVGIELSSPGPIIFSAKRVGKQGKKFTMYKFRTMHVNQEKGHIITLRSDSRIFPLGKFLRKSKIDELPQLFNILKGDLSIVGWRPEDEENVKQVFVGRYKQILRAKPGLTSVGSLYDYTHGEFYETEEAYATEFLPQKMELELYYVTHQSFAYDLQLIHRTVCIILQMVCGKTVFAKPYELRKIKQLKKCKKRKNVRRKGGVK